MPARPGMPQVMRCKLGIEPGPPDCSVPALLDLAAVSPPPIRIGSAFVRQEYRTLAVWQVGEHGGYAWGKRDVYPF